MYVSVSYCLFVMFCIPGLRYLAHLCLVLLASVTVRTLIVFLFGYVACFSNRDFSLCKCFCVFALLSIYVLFVIHICSFPRLFCVASCFAVLLPCSLHDVYHYLLSSSTFYYIFVRFSFPMFFIKPRPRFSTLSPSPSLFPSLT